MKIQKSLFNRYSQIQNRQINKNDFSKKNSNYMQSPNCYCKSYYINFSGAKTLNEVYNTYKDNQMPSTVKTYIEELTSKISAQDFISLMAMPSLKDVQKAAFSRLENCHNIEEIKQTFPQEKYFQDLKSIKEIKTKRFSQLDMFKKLFLEENVVFENGDKDITTYLVKKIFLECKTSEEIKEDLKQQLKSQELKKLCDSVINKDILFNSLGIAHPNKRGYGGAIQYYDTKFSTKISEILKKAKSRKIKNNTIEEYQCANLMLSKIAQKANPLIIKSFDSNKDFYNLLAGYFSLNELEILEGDDKSKEYQQLFPEGIINKIKSLTQNPNFKKLTLAQAYAIMEEICAKSDLDIKNINLEDKKTLETIYLKILEGQKEINAGKINIKLNSPVNNSQINKKYNEYKQSLESKELEQIKEELFKYCALSEKEKNIALEFLSQQGRYMNLVFDDNFKISILTKFWSDFDKNYNTNKLEEVNKVLKSMKIQQQKLDLIESFDWSCYLKNIFETF